MRAQKVDIVFAVDASDSMTPCFHKLRDNLRRFIEPLDQAGFEIRYGLLAYNAGFGPDGGACWHFDFIGGSGHHYLMGLYSPQIDPDRYFTRDAAKFLQALDSVVTRGDEDSFMALDVAGDFPFADLAESRRVIAFFSDEKMEDGICGTKPMTEFREVLAKIVKRKIALHAFLPACDAAAMMTHLPKSIITEVPEGDRCWDHLDFGKILTQMGQSISVSTLQMGGEPEYRKAVYGQDKFFCVDKINMTGR